MIGTMGKVFDALAVLPRLILNPGTKGAGIIPMPLHVKENGEE